ncbi:hypothetical protein SNEBB_009178 [Seison nebaliae]|nr:hypothetical protein SNEBB_009178 [Seison nebaliae]
MADIVNCMVEPEHYRCHNTASCQTLECRIASGVTTIVLVIVIAIICCCCYDRRNKKKIGKSIFNNKHKTNENFVITKKDDPNGKPLNNKNLDDPDNVCVIKIDDGDDKKDGKDDIGFDIERNIPPPKYNEVFIKPITDEERTSHLGFKASID